MFCLFVVFLFFVFDGGFLCFLCGIVLVGFFSIMFVCLLLFFKYIIHNNVEVAACSSG